MSFSDSDQLKCAIRDKDPNTFFMDHLSTGTPKHFDEEKILNIIEVMSNKFDTPLNRQSIIIVGSAMLGYALHEKRKHEGPTLAAFRAYGPDSDVDVTICDRLMFEKIWFELGNHACIYPRSPWNEMRLSEYLIYGWLRPDKFPKGKSLSYCDLFYKTVGQLHRDRIRGHPKLSFALYYSAEQLRFYQERSIRLCKQRMEMP